MSVFATGRSFPRAFWMRRSGWFSSRNGPPCWPWAGCCTRYWRGGIRDGALLSGGRPSSGWRWWGALRDSSDRDVSSFAAKSAFVRGRTQNLQCAGRRGPWRFGGRHSSAPRGIPWGRRPPARPQPPQVGFAGWGRSRQSRQAPGDAREGGPQRACDPGSPRVPIGSWDRLRLWTIWLAGVLLLIARLIIGRLGLARIVRRSSSAPDAIVRECREIAARLGCRQSDRVRSTKEVAAPCLAGLWRPVLILPERECDGARPDDLRDPGSRAGSWRNHDVAWNLAAHVASIVLWFHPLAWRIGAMHVGGV